MGNINDHHELNRMQNVYVAARVNGVPARDAADKAGYSPTTHIAQIERPGGPVHEKIMAALEAKGITWDSLADEYATGIQRSKQHGAKDLDLNAHAQYLKQIGYLLSGGKQGLQVAVQINNGARSVDVDDPGKLEEVLREVKELGEMVEKEIGRRESSGLHAGDPGAGDSGPRAGVAAPDQGSQEVVGGSEP